MGGATLLEASHTFLLMQQREVGLLVRYLQCDVKDNDTTKTANIKIVVLQSWHIFTRTRTIAMFYLKFKIVRTCDFFHCFNDYKS